MQRFGPLRLFENFYRIRLQIGSFFQIHISAVYFLTSGDSIAINVFSPQKIVDKKIYILSLEYPCRQQLFMKYITSMVRPAPKAIPIRPPPFFSSLSTTSLYDFFIQSSITIQQYSQNMKLEKKLLELVH